MRSLLVIPLLFMGLTHACARNHYVDSKNGNDNNAGHTGTEAWKSIAKLQQAVLQPGDTVFFKRGSSFTGPLYIRQSGEPGRYIVLRDYGKVTLPSPAFTNPVFAPGNYGNCIRLLGSYVQVENLFFSGTAACTDIQYSGDGWLVWEMGAIHIARSAEHCIVRNNEIKDCVAGIRSNGAYALITGNYIHDCNRVLKEWNWGPLGIWLGADHQELAYNTIVNYSAVDPRIGWGADSYGNGADGGAFEIDDARFPKSDIEIHHNYTRDCQGFLEVTWTDVKQNPAYSGFRIHHNISDDFQQFIALWRGEGCFIENNTIIRRKRNANDWGVFNITQRNGRNYVRNNIVVTEKNIVVFNTGRKGTAQPASLISHNLYYAASGTLIMGKEGPGEVPVFSDPQFRRYKNATQPADFSLLPGSAAIDKGASVDYKEDFVGTPVASAGNDIGAWEYAAHREQYPDIVIAKDGIAAMPVVITPGASVVQRFAAAELVRYLQRVSGAVFTTVATRRPTQPAVLLRTDLTLPAEDYRLATSNGNVLLTGGSDRALLYAVYDLLHRIGCEWLSPEFSFYEGNAERIPSRSEIRYHFGEIYEHPQFSSRKIDVEEGRTHNLVNLRQLISWMAKNRFNILQVPLNYQGAGRVQWDRWRDSLTPELKRRGLLLEVGGHGYQNFLNARMENGQLFRRHPEWFGRNKDCQPDSAENLVFNTANPEAMKYFLRNVLQYLREHTEIDIFDCWPPDVAKWAECAEMQVLGSPEDRQAMLINQLDSAIKTLKRNIRLEVIAYGQVLQPPLKTRLSSDVMVDICPINQTFEKNIYDTAGNVNAVYARAILLWKKHFAGATGHYSYYRKYAWYSMPVILPHYIRNDMQWYTSLPVQGISTYAEPGDWYTYELNHYAIACLAWNPQTDVDSLVHRYAEARYGPAALTALLAYTQLEAIFRYTGSIPYTLLKRQEVLQEAAKTLRDSRIQLARINTTGTSSLIAANIRRLLLMMDYAISDIEILQLRASGITGAELDKRVQQLVTLLETHADEGVFILRSKNNFNTFIKHYNNIR